MTYDTSCPQCAATMTIVMVPLGHMQDKRMRCSHCQHEIDLPDTYSHTEEQRSADGRSVYRKTVTRIDGASAELLNKPLFDEAFFKSFDGMTPGQVKVDTHQEFKSFVSSSSMELSDDMRRMLEQAVQQTLGKDVQFESFGQGDTRIDVIPSGKPPIFRKPAEPAKPPGQKAHPLLWVAVILAVAALVVALAR